MTTMDQQKKKSLDMTLASIEKQFGKGSIMRLGDVEAQQIPSCFNGMFVARYCSWV